MHLSPDQEYSFQLHAQSYNFYYSHGATNSAGVCIAMKHNSCVRVTRCGESPGHLLALDVQLLTGNLQVVGLYAPSIPTKHDFLFKDMHRYFNGNMMLLGDFNSVISPTDELSGNLDATLMILHDV